MHKKNNNSGNGDLIDLTPETTSEMPVVPYKVLHVDLPFYSDSECRNQITDAHIAVLEAQDPSDPCNELDIVPTRKHYEPGQLVTWFLNNKKRWEQAWFKHPETGDIQRAWTAHVEFVGKIIR